MDNCAFLLRWSIFKSKEVYSTCDKSTLFIQWVNIFFATAWFQNKHMKTETKSAD